MFKRATLASIFILLLILAGCKGGGEVGAGDPNTLESQIDIDLSTLSTTMAYAQVYNILQESEENIGKVIKIHGTYMSTFYEPTGLNYHFILLTDVEACCEAAMEFIWTGEHTFPSDYPEIGTPIELIGKFQKYEELGTIYYYLEVNNIILL